MINPMNTVSREHDNKINKNIEELKEINPNFSDYFIQQVVNILRLNYIPIKRIENIFNPEKYDYNEYGEKNKDINENTTINELVRLYENHLLNQITDKKRTKTNGINIKKKEEHAQFKKDKKPIYTILKYGTNDEKEIGIITDKLSNKEITNEGIPNIQNCINKIYKEPNMILSRQKELIKKAHDSFHNRTYQQQMMKLFKLKYDFFVVDEKGRNGKYESKYYYFPIGYDDMGMKKKLPFKEINRQWLLTEITNIIYLTEGYDTDKIFITLDDCQKMLGYINNPQTFNKEYTELNNVFVHKPTMKIIKKEDLTMEKVNPYSNWEEKREYIYTLDRLGLKEKKGTTNETIKLFHYDPKMTIETLNKDNITDTIKILQQILIPRQEPEEKEIFVYFIQLLGLMVHGNNDIKILPVFYREGNNGKGVLNKIIKLLFGDGATDIKQDRIDDNFINEVITDTSHALINDELTENSIKDNLSTYKQLSGASGIGGRLIHSNETMNIHEIPPLYLATNYIPSIPVTTGSRAIIQRLNLIRMPNIFVNPEEIDETKNEYLEKSGIDNKLKNDYEGLSQLLSLAINEFKKLDYNKNVRNQLAIVPTIQETTYKLNSENPLINYISLYTELMDKETSKTKWITTKMIKEAFIEWYKRENKGLKPPKELIGNNNIGIGTALKIRYGDKLEDYKYKEGNQNTLYCCRILSEYDKEIKEKRSIKTNIIDKTNKQHNQLSDKTKNVYTIIKENNLPNEHEVIIKLKQMGYEENDIIDSLKILDQVGLIEYDKQTTITS